MAFDGLEVDQRHRSLGTEGLQTAPAELQPGNGSSPQFLPGPDIEAITVDSQPKADVLNTSRNSIFRRRWKLLLLLAIAVIVVIVIAVAVPLGIIHKGGSSDSADKEATSSPHSGAFNGTGLTTFNADVNAIPTTHLYYQDVSGQIRRLQKFDSHWTGGPGFPAIVTSGAKNATPLASAHLFYVDPSDILREVISTDNLSTWLPPSKSSPSAKALTATHSESWFGARRANSCGLRLYYGAPDSQVHELASALGDTSPWSPQFFFNGTNGNAGISGTTVDEDNGYARLYVLDGANDIRVWTLNATVKPSTTAGAYGNWTEDPTLPSLILAPNSAISYSQGWLAYQAPSLAISAVQAPTGPSGSWGSTMAVGGPEAQYAAADAKIATGSVWLGPDKTFPNSLDFFFQGGGEGVEECIDESGGYTTTELPV